MEPRNEKLYEAGLALGRKAAHERYWKQAMEDARKLGQARGLSKAKSIGYTEDRAWAFADGYARAIMEHCLLNFYICYSRQIEDCAKSFAEGYAMNRREAIRCGYKGGNEEVE